MEKGRSRRNINNDVDDVDGGDHDVDYVGNKRDDVKGNQNPRRESIS